MPDSKDATKAWLRNSKPRSKADIDLLRVLAELLSPLPELRNATKHVLAGVLAAPTRTYDLVPRTPPPQCRLISSALSR